MIVLSVLLRSVVFLSRLILRCAISLAAVTLPLVDGGEADAACNAIPGTIQAFRAAQGTIDRPFAGPDEFDTLRVDTLCDDVSPGFTATPGEFGAPLTTTDYALCVYDSTGVIATATVPPGGVCGVKPCWAEKSTGYNFKNKDLPPDGVTQIVLREGLFAGKAKVQVKGKGVPLAMPDLPIVNLPVTVQLHNDAGECWQAVYTTPTKNEDQQFSAKGG